MFLDQEDVGRVLREEVLGLLASCGDVRAHQLETRWLLSTAGAARVLTAQAGRWAARRGLCLMEPFPSPLVAGPLSASCIASSEQLLRGLA